MRRSGLILCLLLATPAKAAAETSSALQDKVDRALTFCRYSGPLKFKVETGSVVSIESTVTSSTAPSPAEIAQFHCVLRKLKEIKGLSYGFVGNEIETKETKK